MHKRCYGRGWQLGGWGRVCHGGKLGNRTDPAERGAPGSHRGPDDACALCRDGLGPGAVLGVLRRGKESPLTKSQYKGSSKNEN